VVPFISVSAPVFALTHVRVIDGTGAAAVDGQTVVVADGLPPRPPTHRAKIARWVGHSFISRGLAKPVKG